MDEKQAERGQAWLGDLVRLMGVDTEIAMDGDRYETEGSYWLTIGDTNLTPDQVQTLTGDRGMVLDAMQYLANITLNLGQPDGQQCAYTIELCGYRAKRQAELQAIAEEAVQAVRQTGQDYEIPSLSAAERRQVHTFLKVYEDLETESRGREPDRRLVVRLLQPDQPV